MGLYASAELIYGLPILAYDEETSDPTPFWDESAEDWINLSEVKDYLKIRPYGHYDDQDNLRAILTTPRIERYRGDCWTPKLVAGTDAVVSDKAVSRAVEMMRYLDLPGDFYMANWYLVASFG